MKQIIEEKISLLKSCIEEMGGIIDLVWCGDLLYPYYEHFNDSNHRFRAGSLVAFLGLLLEWEDGSGFPFYTGVEEYNCHHFNKYLEEFLMYFSEIKERYPNIYLVIVEKLKFLDKKDNFESKFPNICGDLFRMVREKLFHENIQKPVEVYNVLKEAGMLLR